MNSVILAENFCEESTTAIYATSSHPDYPVDFLRDRQPHKVWLAGSLNDQTITINTSGNRNCDCLAICGHNLKGATISFIIGSQTMETRVAASDKAIMFTVSERLSSTFKLIISNPQATPFIGALLVGKRIDFPVKPNAPYAPIEKSMQTAENNSESGNSLEVITTYKQLRANPTYTNVDRNFVQTVYNPFFEQYGEAGKYFIFAWDNEHAPDEVIFCKFSSNHVHNPNYRTLLYVDTLQLSLVGRQ